MSVASVRSAVAGSTDRLAAWVKDARAIVQVGNGTIWERVDASEDVDYENAVEGPEIAAVDSRIAAQSVGDSIRDFFTTHGTYFSGKGFGNWEGYLVAQRVRVHDFFGELYYRMYSQRLSAAHVYGDTDRTIGLYTYSGTGNLYSPTAGIPTATLGPAIVEALVSAAHSPGVIYSVTALNQQGSPVTFALTLTGAGAGSRFALGEEALTTDAVVGVEEIGIAESEAFSVGDRIVVVEGVKTEIADVASITADTHLSLTSATLNSFTTGAYVYPLFREIRTIIAGTGKYDADAMVLRAKPDRVAAW